MDIISSLQNAMEIAGRLHELSKKIEDVDFKMLLADLTNDLADAKLDAANLKIALANSLEENESIKKILAQKSTLVPTLFDGAYAFEGEEGQFCTACFDTTQKKVRVTPHSGVFRRFGKWRCPACNASLG